ncbi:hypothetical protein Poli38472_008233 [Pythium oligandrum]|uniref:Cytochrome P450 n=1 Tax=Pythium oligandrum TaxID=41045 RepID=A0A8K1CMY3_PYTOL|nr:hypothetical protein Poli38472_008233 [Pythium oligandrum]|eukprot:TMW65591.1 hypothetical protein Poli38472_008233 [Pythium oligandrum]
MLVIPPVSYDDKNTMLAVGGALAVCLLTWFHHHSQYQRQKRLAVDEDGNPIKLREIPYQPGGLPIIGNLLEIVRNRHRIYDWSVEQCLRFKGQPFKRRIPGQPEIVTFCTPEPIEEITTKQFDNFIKGELQVDVLEGLFGRALIASDGERWYHQRKTAAKFFSARALRAFMNKAVHKNIDEVCDVFERAIQANEQVDLLRLFHEFTLQTFVEMGVGLDLKWIGREEPHPFFTSMHTATLMMQKRLFQPAWSWRLQRYFNIGPERRFKEEMSVIRTWLRDVLKVTLADINKRKKEGKPAESNGEAIKSVIELFVETSNEEVEGGRTEDLVEFLQTFIFGARDTTALTMSWLFYELGRNPHVVQAMRDEIKLKLPAEAANHNVCLTTEHIRHLVYLEATLKELLRLHPVAPSTLKYVVRDTVICGDIPLYKGQMVLLSAYAMARNPDVWGPDAAEFKPERWIDPKTGKITPVPSSKFFTFHSGPRTCVGMNLAMLELRVVLANLVNRYDFEMDPSNDGSYIPSPLMLMKYPLWAKVTRVESF